MIMKARRYRVFASIRKKEMDRLEQSNFLGTLVSCIPKDLDLPWCLFKKDVDGLCKEALWLYTKSGHHEGMQIPVHCKKF